MDEVRVLGQIEDYDGARLSIGVDHSHVTVGHYRLNGGQRDLFMRLFLEAERAAEKWAEDDITRDLTPG